MKLSLGSVILSILLACRATPTKQGPNNDKCLGGAKGDAVGAAYFMTNDPTGNYIIGSDVGPDGLLTLRRATDAGGIGLHGLHDLGVDGLFSAGSIQVSNDILLTVNAGSDTIVAFKIQPDDPTDLRMIGKPVSSHGEFPVSIAVNKAGDRACVLNSGTMDGVSCYTLDEHKGLSEIPNTIRPVGLNQTTPSTGTAGTVSSIVFSEDETQLYAAVKATDPAINVDVHPGFFAVWDINSDGSLSECYTVIPVPEGGKQPFAMTFIPNQNAIFGADGSAGFYVWDLSTIAEERQGPRASLSTIDPMSSICWSGYSAGTGNFFVVDGNINIISEIHLDDNLKPTVIKSYPQAATDGTIDFDIAPVGNMDHLYVLAANATAVFVFSLEAPGQMSRIQSVDFLAPATAAGLTIDPNNPQGMKVFLK